MKILFVIDSLRKGGIRTSLLNLLANFNYKRYDVYLFCFHITESDEKYIPQNVTIIYPNKLFDLVASTSNELKSVSYKKYFFRFFLSALCRIFNSDIIYNLIFKTEKRLFCFDVAISYTNNVSDHSLYFGSNKFVIEKVESKKKITWLHADYEKMHLNTAINNKEYEKFSQIITVSHETSNSFIKYNPNFKEKIVVIYNLINKNFLKNNANAMISENISNDKLNFITISRLDKNKDPEKIIKIALELKKSNFKFKWRVIGDGPLLNEMKRKTDLLDLKNEIIWYGFLENPYPYLKQSDLYISTSKSEGYSLSIVESLFFSVPVLAGYYNSINEILSLDSGWIVKNNYKDYIEILNIIFMHNDILNEKKMHVSILHKNSSILKKLDEVLYVENY